MPVRGLDAAVTLVGTDGVSLILGSSLKVVVTGGVQQTDKSIFTEGTTTFVPIGGEFKDARTRPTDGQTAAARLTGFRGLHTKPRDHSRVEGHSATDWTL